MAHLHTGRALGSGPSIHVEFYADAGTRTTSGTYITLTAIAYFAYANSSLGASNTLTAHFYVNGAWYSVPIKWTQSSGTISGGSWTKIGSGSSSIFISCSDSTTSIPISYVKTTSTTMNTSGIMGQTAPTVANSVSIVPVYSVSYNLNGGSGSFPTQEYVYGGSNINLHSTVPTKSGYNFLGWSLSSTATSASYYAGQTWSSSNGSNYTLYAVWEVANGKSTITLSGDVINLDNPFTVYTIRQSTSNTHTIVLTLPTGSYTLATGVGASHTFTLPASTWARYFTNSKSVDGIITVTTYSGSTSLGSVSQGVTVALPESIGKPDKPIAILSTEHAASATIDLKKPILKYGATFKEWQIETNIGKAKVIGNRIHVGVDPTINKTAVVTVCAVDSRGFMSDPVSVQWHKRKTGGRIFIDGMWK